MSRAFPHLMWFLGVVLLLVGLSKLAGAGIPYQDPTPALLERQQDQINAAKNTAALGWVLLISGIAWLRHQNRCSR